MDLSRLLRQIGFFALVFVVSARVLAATDGGGIENADGLHAEAGNAEQAAAQRIKGQRYLNGVGVPRDFAAAAALFRRAAANGDLKARVLLATMLENGEAGPKDPDEAMRLVRTAAEQGSPDAQWMLASYHELGHIVPKDLEAARRWYRSAADQGFAQAQLSLGLLHDRGLGIPRNTEEAIHWYRLAAAQGLVKAQSLLGARLIDEGALGADPPRGIELLRQTADRDPISALMLGIYTERGRLVERDVAEAARLYRHAADRKLALGQFLYGRLLIEGRGVAADPSAGASLMTEAATAGLALAQYYLSTLHARGLGVPQDSDAELRWVRRAAEQDHAVAQHNLATLLVKQGHADQAIPWAERSGRQGMINAFAVLGIIYLQGEGGVNVNPERAWMFLDLASRQGHAQAKEMLTALTSEMETAAIDQAKTLQRMWINAPSPALPSARTPAVR